ncbi:flagellin [Pararhodobacter sp. SW119]|uniref:flagellin N-terminal helical domain-containing protein n=1 Tax=Pararhodobacter sp. SW119 TaxID=2780075 RepID=UPI001ADEC92E|nr:flagellin [Pararhodobacter sp. SW119]
MSSILTNNSAMVALQTMKQINKNMGQVQSQISTGMKVATAKDNAAVWAIAKVMETDQTAFKTIQSNLNVADATVSVARNGAEQITNILKEMKELAIGGANDAADHVKIETDILAKKAQITSIINASQLNGVNLLKTNPVAGETSYNVLGSLDRTNGTVATAPGNITVASANFEGGLDLTSVAAITDRATALTAIGTIEALVDIAIVGAANLGSAGKRISDQAEFIGKLSDSLKAGMGALVDADMEEASARLQALQVQQQLATQSLSIANQQPQNILALFR